MIRPVSRDRLNGLAKDCTNFSEWMKLPQSCTKPSVLFLQWESLSLERWSLYWNRTLGVFTVAPVGAASPTDYMVQLALMNTTHIKLAISIVLSYIYHKVDHCTGPCPAAQHHSSHAGSGRTATWGHSMPRGRLNIKMQSHQYRDPILEIRLGPSHLYYGNFLYLERQSLYWNRAQTQT